MSPEQASGKIGKFVGEKLRELRIAHNYTQSQLASPDFSISYISAIERGQIRPSLRALEIFAQRLGVPSTYLLPQQGDPRISNAPFDSEEDDFTLLQAQLAIWQGAPAQARALLEAMETGHWPHPQLLRYHYLLGWACLESGHAEQSTQQLNAALEIANNFHPSFKARILALLGLAYAAMRDYRQAIASHQSCLALLEEAAHSDTYLRAQVCFYLGQDYLAQAQVQQADEMLRTALALLATLETSQARQTYYTESMHSALEASTPDLFSLSAHKALSLSLLTSVAQQRSILYYQLGELLLQQNAATEETVESIDTYLSRALERAIAAQDVLSIASLSLHKARVELKRQAPNEATPFIQHALTLMQGQSDSLTHALVLLTAGELAYEQHHFKQGDRELVAGLDMLQRLGASDEYAQYAVRYAHLLEQRGQIRESLLYYKRAYEHME